MKPVFYVYDSAQGFDRETARRCDSLAEAGDLILADDQRAAGVDWERGLWEPWQRRMDGRLQRLRLFSRATRRESLEAIAASGAFQMDCFTEAEAAECESQARA